LTKSPFKRENMKKTIVALMAAVGLVAVAYAVGITNPVVNESALAYSKRYVIDLQNAAVNTVTATAVYSSATLSNISLTTGQTAAGYFTVADNTVLTTATATNSIVVASTSGAVGDSLVITQLTKPGALILTAGRDWNYGINVTSTAISIKAALDKVSKDFTTGRSGATLTLTATTPGANANAIRVTTNNTDTLTVGAATFTGGRNATVVTVNGYPFKAGVNFAVGAADSNTATNLANAINARATVSAQVVAAKVDTAKVTVDSLKVGTVSNFSLATSNSSGISKSGVAMTGGTNASWALGSKNITAAAHGLTLAYPVLYRLGAGAAAISGLTGETTYYAIPVDANTTQLADSSAHAIAGTGIVLASSSTLASAKSYSLLPLAFTAAATTGGKWQVSNDNSSWSDVSASTVSWIAGGGAGSTNWNLGLIQYRYLGFNVVGPATGGLTLNVTAFGTYTTP
jgi:hypothetical protein